MRKVRNRKSLEGKRFNYLVARELFYKNGYKHWKCECDCGKIVERQEWYLLNTSTNASCGCQHPHRTAYGNKNKCFVGIEDIGGTYIAGLKNKCKKNGIEYNVSKEYLWELFLNQDKKCSLTKMPIEFSSYKQRIRTGKEQTASLDRIDSDKGYVEGNLQWVHKDVNLMKNHFSQERFIEICKLVSRNYND